MSNPSDSNIPITWRVWRIVWPATYVTAIGVVVWAAPEQGGLWIMLAALVYWTLLIWQSDGSVWSWLGGLYGLISPFVWTAIWTNADPDGGELRGIASFYVIVFIAPIGAVIGLALKKLVFRFPRPPGPIGRNGANVADVERRSR